MTEGPKTPDDGRPLVMGIVNVTPDSFSDGGRFASADAALDHQPTATGDKACLCLVVTDAPIRLTGKLGRLLNPLIKYQ